MSLAFITFQPIRNVTENDVGVKLGVVTSVVKGNGGHIFIKLKNDSHNYYIKKGLHTGLTLDKLSKAILQKEVTLHYIKKWTPISRDGVFPHISKLTTTQQVVFNEIINK